MPLFRGSSRFESLIVSHHARFTCECNNEEIIDDDDDDDVGSPVSPAPQSTFRVQRSASMLQASSSVLQRPCVRVQRPCFRV